MKVKEEKSTQTERKKYSVGGGGGQQKTHFCTVCTRKQKMKQMPELRLGPGNFLFDYLGPLEQFWSIVLPWTSQK